MATKKERDDLEALTLEELVELAGKLADDPAVTQERRVEVARMRDKKHAEWKAARHAAQTSNPPPQELNFGNN